jgi:hypothetical protein
VDAEVRQSQFTSQRRTAWYVEYTLTEGSQFRIGRIDVTRNEQTKDKAVRRVLDETATPGKLYNARSRRRKAGPARKVRAEIDHGTAIMIRPVEPAEKEAAPARRCPPRTVRPLAKTHRRAPGVKDRVEHRRA